MNSALKVRYVSKRLIKDDQQNVKKERFWCRDYVFQAPELLPAQLTELTSHLQLQLAADSGLLW